MKYSALKEIPIYTSDEVKNTIIPKVRCRECGELMNEYNFYYDKEKNIITKKYRRTCDDCLKQAYFEKKELAYQNYINKQGEKL